ncbi:MAG: TolC family protein [Muribaculaceae bacterium]|nr:TolC family protein [Muribaculaceae bacterium]
MIRMILSALAVATTVNALATNPFSDIEQEIAENNPELASARLEYESSRLNDAADNNLIDPEVEFEQLWSRGGHKKWSAGISQSFDWPGAYGARSNAARTKAEARSMMLERQQSEVMFKARGLMLEIVGINRQLELTDSILSNLSLLEERIGKAVGQGHATRLDLGKIKFAALSLMEDRDSRLNQLAAARASLNALNGGKATDISGLTVYPSERLLDEKDYIDAFDNSNPYLPAMQAQVRAAEAEAKAVSRSALPSFTVGYRHAYEEEMHYNGFAVGMSLPFLSTRHKKKAAEADALARSLDMDSYRFSGHAAIIADVASARRMKQRLESFEKTFSDADYSSILKRLYENGQIGVIDYITEINYYLDIRRQYLQLQNEYQLTLASLNRYL